MMLPILLAATACCSSVTHGPKQLFLDSKTAIFRGRGAFPSSAHPYTSSSNRQNARYAQMESANQFGDDAKSSALSCTSTPHHQYCIRSRDCLYRCTYTSRRQICSYGCAGSLHISTYVHRTHLTELLTKTIQNQGYTRSMAKFIEGDSIAHTYLPMMS